MELAPLWRYESPRKIDIGKRSPAVPVTSPYVRVRIRRFALPVPVSARQAAHSLADFARQERTGRCVLMLYGPRAKADSVVLTFEGIVDPKVSDGLQEIGNF
jgi:hypothetical protein